MPGFNICGSGALANGPSNTMETKRKHRWYFKTLGNLQANFLLVLKDAARPQFTFDEATWEHNQETVYFAGKQKWAETKLSWYDVENNPNTSAEVWKWLQKTVQIDGGNLPVSTPSEYKIDGELAMIDGRGDETEVWKMCGCWPKDINWQTLDYGSSEIMMVEVSMRYDRANKTK